MAQLQSKDEDLKAISKKLGAHSSTMSQSNFYVDQGIQYRETFGEAEDQ
uniref:Uncharacterized protein n=1 Tax=Romanomermis culicivorax TaxID=13658 RepID=A0A915KJS7_ROMCU